MKSILSMKSWFINVESRCLFWRPQFLAMQSWSIWMQTRAFAQVGLGDGWLRVCCLKCRCVYFKSARLQKKWKIHSGKLSCPLKRSHLKRKGSIFETTEHHIRRTQKVQHWLVEEQFLEPNYQQKVNCWGCEPSCETDVYWECALKRLNCPNRLPPSADGCWRSSIQYW